MVVLCAGWLLTTCTNPVAASNAKLALFYDWLFFDAEKVGTHYQCCGSGIQCLFDQGWKKPGFLKKKPAQWVF